jgi:hypothetical protein
MVFDQELLRKSSFIDTIKVEGWRAKGRSRFSSNLLSGGFLLLEIFSSL